jgi:hypothetical protein
VGTKAEKFSRGEDRKCRGLSAKGETYADMAGVNVNSFYADDGQRRPLKHSLAICVLTGYWIWHFSGSLLGQKIVKGDP